MVKGELQINEYTYQLEECVETRIYIKDSDEIDGTIAVSVELKFKAGEYDGENVKPSVCVEWHETGVADFGDLVGKTFSVDDMEDAYDREDTFYLFEHEPMESYSFSILEIQDGEVHITITGVAIIDGYAEPYEVADFNIDCWLPIK